MHVTEGLDYVAILHILDLLLIEALSLLVSGQACTLRLAPTHAVWLVRPSHLNTMGDE